MTSQPIPPTGVQVALHAGPYHAVITEVGAGLRLLTHRGNDLVDPYDETDVVTGCRGQVLAPWPNRVDGGRYEVAGKMRQLDLSEPERGNASHGLVRWAAWRIQDASVAGGPYDFRSGARFDGQTVDHAYTDLTRAGDGRVTAQLLDPATGQGASLWADESCPFIQVYTGDRLRPTPRTGLAVEPMSCAPNAFVTGDGLRWLEPDGSITHTFGIASIGS